MSRSDTYVLLRQKGHKYSSLVLVHPLLVLTQASTAVGKVEAQDGRAEVWEDGAPEVHMQEVMCEKDQLHTVLGNVEMNFNQAWGSNILRGVFVTVISA